MVAGAGGGFPLGFAGLDRVDDHFLFARDLPRNFARGPGLGIRAVVRAFRYARDHLARGFRFVLPELREQRSFVHAASCRSAQYASQRRASRTPCQLSR
jgi:hypothetical protein